MAHAGLMDGSDSGIHSFVVFLSPALMQFYAVQYLMVLAKFAFYSPLLVWSARGDRIHLFKGVVGIPILMVVCRDGCCQPIAEHQNHPESVMNHDS